MARDTINYWLYFRIIPLRQKWSQSSRKLRRCRRSCWWWFCRCLSKWICPSVLGPGQRRTVDSTPTLLVGRRRRWRPLGGATTAASWTQRPVGVQHASLTPTSSSSRYCRDSHRRIDDGSASAVPQTSRPDYPSWCPRARMNDTTLPVLVSIPMKSLFVAAQPYVISNQILLLPLENYVFVDSIVRGPF